MLTQADMACHARDPQKLKRLLSAVIIRAVADYVSYKHRRSAKAAKLFDAAAAWLMADIPVPRGAGYTFVQACDALNMDVSALRGRLDVLQVREIERFRRVMSPEGPADGFE